MCVYFALITRHAIRFYVVTLFLYRQLFFGLLTLPHFLQKSRNLHYFRKSASLDFLYNFSSSSYYLIQEEFNKLCKYVFL
jgi:hypothetical protein